MGTFPVGTLLYIIRTVEGEGVSPSGSSPDIELIFLLWYKLSQSYAEAQSFEPDS